MPVLYKKAVAAGLKGSEVKAIADQVREKFGVKQIKKGPELVAAFEEIKKRLGEDVEPAPAPKVASIKPAPKSEKAPEPKPQSVKPTPKSEKVPSVKPEPTPAPAVSKEPSKASSKISEEKLKATFERAIANEARFAQQKEALRAQGKNWDDPEYSALTRKEGKAKEAALLVRQAYYAQDREAFLRAAGERKKLIDESDRLSREGYAMQKRDGLNQFNVPENHPSKALIDKSYELRNQANSEPKERMHAAYYGEPAKLSKAPSDGGGKASASVPTSLPRGGADKDLKDFLDGAEPVMAFNPKGFAKFVKEGETKNGFEAGTGGVKKGQGKAYLEGRMRGEETVMGIPKNADPKSRPVYAALEHPDRARSLQGGEGKQMSQYGGVQVIFKNEVKDRATFTIGDSLDAAMPRGIQASPVRDPANPSSPRTQVQDINYGGGLTSGRMSISSTYDEGRKIPNAYVEAQIHGGLRTSDIKEVRYYKGHDIPTATRRALEKQGVRIVELPPQMNDLRVERDSPNYSDITAVERYHK